MLKEIFQLFAGYESFSFLRVIQYISFRGTYAAITALALSLFFGPIFIRFIGRINFRQRIREEGPSTHHKKASTPTMGGLLIMFVTVVSVFLWQDLHNFYTWICFLAIVGFGVLGFVDDYLKVLKKSSAGLRSSVKFTGQILFSLVIVWLLYLGGGGEEFYLYVPFFKRPVFNLSWLFIPFGVLVLVATSNAVNLTDGLDGLATGLIINVLLAFSVLAYLSGHKIFAEYLLIPYVRGAGEIVIVTLALLGASIGFLWFNCHPSQVMMGDTGSLFLGGVIGVIALMLKKEILLMIIGGVFVIETLSVIVQVLYFKRTGQRIFKMAPLHHHFELLGWDESKVVTRFWIVGGLCTIIGLSTLKIR